MVKLKDKIKVIDSLPNDNNKKKSYLSQIITSIIIIMVLIISGLLTYKHILPYINAVDINKITGRKTYFSECNTKDYVIIGKDKSFSLSLTNESCNTEYYEGNISIKNNEIIFNKNIKGIVDNNYNITINNKIFASDNNE